MRIEVFESSELVAEAAANFTAGLACRAVASRGQFLFAVSGGSTPARFLERLSSISDNGEDSDSPGEAVELIDWSKVHLLQVDERVAPNGDPARNIGMISSALFGSEILQASSLASFSAMPVTEAELVDTAKMYSKAIEQLAGEPAVLDLVQLGLGDDGHTASLVPDDPILQIQDRDIALTKSYKGHRRMSMTAPILSRARQQLWIVTGASKADALHRYVSGDESIPAGLVDQYNATVFADVEAAKHL